LNLLMGFDFKKFLVPIIGGACIVVGIIAEMIWREDWYEDSAKQIIDY